MDYLTNFPVFTSFIWIISLKTPFFTVYKRIISLKTWIPKTYRITEQCPSAQMLLHTCFHLFYQAYFAKNGLITNV